MGGVVQKLVQPIEFLTTPRDQMIPPLGRLRHTKFLLINVSLKMKASRNAHSKTEHEAQWKNPTF